MNTLHFIIHLSLINIKVIYNLGIVNSAAMNIFGQESVKMPVFKSFGMDE